MSKTTERKDFESIPTINKLFFQIDKECATRYVKKWFQIFIEWQDIWKGFCDPTIVCFEKKDHWIQWWYELYSILLSFYILPDWGFQKEKGCERIWKHTYAFE